MCNTGDGVFFMKHIQFLENPSDVSVLLKGLKPVEENIEDILDVLEEVSKLWIEDGVFFNKAKDFLEKNPIFGKKQDLAALKLIGFLCQKSELKERIESELGSIKALDGFVSKENYEGKVFYASVGRILHITAGNVFLGAIDSFLMGVITKNINIVKLSSNNLFIPNLFLESIILVDKRNKILSSNKFISYSSSKTEVVKSFKEQVDGIIVWGGDDAIKAYKENLSSKVRFLDHGPKISFQVIDNYYLTHNKDVYEKIALDISTWNQQACSNPQNIFLADDVDFEEFSLNLHRVLEADSSITEILTSDDYVEILKEAQLGLFQEYLSGHKSVKGKNSLISYECGELSTTVLNKSVKIKVFSDLKELKDFIKRYRKYLQTCGLGVDCKKRSLYTKELALCGVKRFTRPGKMLESLSGSAHDGSYSLLEFINVCNDELKPNINEFCKSVNVPYYNSTSQKLSDFPIVDGIILSENSLVTNQKFYDSSYDSGFVFSSGGTTGKPKYIFYAYEEFEKVCKLLATSYLANGLLKGDKVANLFMAGNMWSSFNAIQKALEFCQVIQYPIGGLVQAEDFKKYISEFKINIIFGLPSLLIELANLTKGLQIDKIFYAGEAFSESGKALIQNNWGCKEIISAGYASVDVGPIGYQDSTCTGSQHILFNELVHLEVIDEEAVVTSKVRKSMPVIRYRTGDKVKILEKSGSLIKFDILGRVDNKINIWGSRFEMADLDSIINQNYQIILKSIKKDDKLYDELEIRADESLDGNLSQKLYQQLKDVRDTIDYNQFFERVKITSAPFLKNNKTGKFKKFNDLRS
jgi:phenylacetate-CoA ligase